MSCCDSHLQGWHPLVSKIGMVYMVQAIQISATDLNKVNPGH